MKPSTKTESNFITQINGSALFEKKPGAGGRRGAEWRRAVGIAAIVVSLVSGMARAADPESVDFDSGALSDSFSDNVLYGGSPYSLGPVGVNHTRGIALKETSGSEGTLVFKKKTFDLSKLATLEISCFFKRKGIGAGTHALSLGLTSAETGHLSGVEGAAFVGLRLKAETESLRMQFQSKEAKVASPQASQVRDDFPTEAGKWYQLKAIFARLDDKTLRVTGEVSPVSDAGEVDSPVGFFPLHNFWVGDFHFAEIVGGHKVWVALRANGDGGAEALDNFQIVARPLPDKAP